MNKSGDGQHFLLSAKLRDFTLWDASNLSEEEAFWRFTELRWGSREQVVCPSCGAIAKQSSPNIAANSVQQIKRYFFEMGLNLSYSTQA
jgi:hypothetical protein